MLDDVARNMVTLSDKELALVLDAMEVSINSIEEMSAC
jgi:DNA-binding XRE family transcriptional regulator